MTRLLPTLKMAIFPVLGLLEIGYYCGYGPSLWWGRRRGRDDEVAATVVRISVTWGQRIMRRLHCRVEVEGREHVPQSGPVIVMCNHQSMFDIPILMGHLGRLLGFVTKRELFRIPGLSHWMRNIGCIALDRSDAHGAAKLFREVSLAIKEAGSGIILFPEGTRTRDPEGKIGPFKEGSARLATLQNIPILPVSLDGSRFLSRSSAMARTVKGGRVVRVKIAPPVYPNIASARERHALMTEIRETILTNFEAIRLEWPTPAGPEAAAAAGAAAG